jgi:predicted porin
VTLYGVIDAPIEYVNHFGTTPPTQNPATGQLVQSPTGGSLFRMPSYGGLSSSRWGMRGTEELGNGLQAIFVLESGFGSDDGSLQYASGSGARIFGRQAFVGMQSKDYGKLTLGRQYNSMFWAMANFSPTYYSTLYEPVVAQLGANFREDNTVQYTGAFGPITAVAHYSFGTGLQAVGVTPTFGGGAGEVPGHAKDNSGYGAGVTYLGGGFGASVAYDQWNPNFATTAGNAGSAKKAAAALSYTWGPAKVMAGYRWGQLKAANGGTLARDDYYWAAVNYQVNAPISLTLAYYYDDVKVLRTATTTPVVNLPNPWQITFQADYAFSKRTDVYLATAYAKNGGLNLSASNSSFSNGYFLTQGNDNQVGVAIGIRHKF